MRIAVCHPHAPFVRGGAETHAQATVRALQAAGHEAEIVAIPWKWYPPTELVHQMALWRSLDLSESNGQPIDALIAFRFPAYLVRHERKIVWLIHQHRSAYELWDHPQFADLSRHEDGTAVRDLVRQADRTALAEAKRIFSNSRNVRERLARSVGLPAEVLYHRSPLTETLLEAQAGPVGDYVLFPSRLEPIKRQSLAVEAMRHVRSGVRLVLVGSGPGEAELRSQVDRRGLAEKVTLEGGVSDERLQRLYLGALAVHYGPYDEDYGYVTLEGLAAGRPVVCTADSGGPLEFVRDGETGLVAEADPRSVAAAFDRLHADRDLAVRLGARGRELIREIVPPWPRVVERLLE